jgi:glycosyltransferase involved in cell wall biosynthesis
MKILILQDFLRSGGTERQSVLMANAFTAEGHEVNLLTFRPGGALATTVAPGVRLRALQPIDVGLDWLAPRLHAIVASIAPDVILCMGRMANCRAGGLQRAFPAAAVVATMRTGKPLPGAFRRSLGEVRAIVANSQEARETLVRNHAVPVGRIHVIRNALVFPPRPAAADAAGVRAAHGAGPDTRVLLCVAMLRPEKNQRELIEIAAELPREADWQLWLAGEGVSRAECTRTALAAGVADRVRFLGFQPNPAPLYAAADVAVHASWSEALSNFLAESQAHGLPAVAYEAQGIRECVRPDRTGWVIPRGDQAAFRRALHHCLNLSPSARRTLAAEAREHALSHFDPARQAEAYLQLFRQMAPRPAP